MESFLLENTRGPWGVGHLRVVLKGFQRWSHINCTGLSFEAGCEKVTITHRGKEAEMDLTWVTQGAIVKPNFRSRIASIWGVMGPTLGCKRLILTSLGPPSGESLFHQLEVDRLATKAIRMQEVAQLQWESE